jgi:hypothetical protein
VSDLKSGWKRSARQLAGRSKAPKVTVVSQPNVGCVGGNNGGGMRKRANALLYSHHFSLLCQFRFSLYHSLFDRKRAGERGPKQTA